jgi:mono/diheme cytochrome c family protein
MSPRRMLGALCLLCGVAQAQSISVRSGAGPAQVLTGAMVRGHASAGRVTVFEPHEGRDLTFHAVPLPALLDGALGPAWRAAEDLLLTCSDGYQPVVPVAEAARGWLAWARVDQPDFVVTRRGGAAIALAPYYLVWEGRDPTGTRHTWAYQVMAFQTVSFATRFPRLAPDESAPPAVSRGFAHFRKWCHKCHALNGEGGQVGPELNYPVSVTELWRREWLLKWIVNPSSVRHRARMPPGLPGVADPAAAAEEIVRYLEVMATRKQAPAPN